MKSRAWGLLGLIGAVVMGGALLDPLHRQAGAGFLDAYGTAWFFWWTERALAAGASPGWTDLLFFPWGKDLYLHTGGNLLDAVLAMPLFALLGPVAGMNAWYALVLAGNAWAGLRIAEAAGAGRVGRGLGAALALLQPAALHELNLGRPTQALLVFSGLWIASLLRPPSVARGVCGGLCLGLSGLAYWYHGLLGAVVGGVSLALRVAAGPARWREVLRHAVAASVALAVALPLAMPMLGALGEGAVPGLLALADSPGPLGRLRLVTAEGDVQPLFVVAADGGTGGLLEDGADAHIRYDEGTRMVYGSHGLVLLIGAVAVATRWRARPAPGARRIALSSLLLLVAWAAVLLWAAKGPALVFGARIFADPLWLFATERLDVLRRWWWPGRALLVAHLVLAGLGGAMLGLVAPRWRKSVAAMALGWLGIGMVREGTVPFEWWDARTPKGIACLRDAPAGAIVELPYALDQKDLWWQTLHGKPMLGGMLVTKDAFLPAEHRALVADNSFLRLLLDIGDHQYTRPLDHEPSDRQELLDLGYRYVLARKDGFLRGRPQRDGSTRWEPDWQRPRRVLGPVVGPPAWEDDGFAVYTLDGSAFSCLDGY